jgi:hypothetical protein
VKLNWNHMLAGAALFIGGLLWSTHLGPKTPGPMTWQYSQYATIGSLAMSVGFGVMYTAWRRRGAGPNRRP